MSSERADHFRPSDLPLLVQYCEAAALAERAVREIGCEGPASKWTSTWKEANRVMSALCARLRVCPQSRQPNNPKRPERMSYYQRQELEEGDGDEE